MLVKLSHYSKRLVQMGPAAAGKLLTTRLSNKIFYYSHKRKACANQAHHTWSAIVRAHNAPFLFADFFAKQQQITFPWIVQNYFPIFLSPISLPVRQSLGDGGPLRLHSQSEFLLREIGMDEFFGSQLHVRHSLGDDGSLQDWAKVERVMNAANAATNNCFDLLGSGPQTCTKIPWHTDFRLQAQNPAADCDFDAHSFYKDIVITSGKTDEILKDIKVPWELSRFQHLFALGYAYKKTGDEKYVHTFKYHVSDWLHHNPFLLGINWVCPMEVALRSINWLVAFDFFKQSSTITKSFWQQVVCSLYDHWYYLEHNWELYDGITSNHYISDLVGYFYLCYFFQDLPDATSKRDWCYQELLREFEKQIFFEGASYEASTGYHRLVTELFFHFFALCEQQNLPVTAEHKNKLERMFNFIQWCTPHGGSMVHIGDHDSGFVFNNGITHELLNKNSSPSFGVRHFKQFGLSVIKTEQWHVTLRHLVYQPRQVTGHFHNDFGSITLAYNGVPILVDSGSFVYTPSAEWRNKFRSVTMHNTFFLEGFEPIPLDERLFFLNMQPSQMPVQSDGMTLNTHHDLYSAYGLRFKRQVNLDESAGVLTINDGFESVGNYHGDYPKSCWNFTFAPEISLYEHNNRWYIKHQEKMLMTLHSPDLTFTVQNSWVSPEYGQKISTLSLQAHCSTVPGRVVQMIVAF